MPNNRLISNIKIWWGNLAARERWLVAGGGSFAIILLAYVYLWQPFSTAVAQVRNQVKTDQALIQWLKPAVQKIQTLRAQGAQAQSGHNQSLLVTVNQTTSQAEIASFVSQIQQNSDNQVNVSFNEVPFDYLIKWLDLLWKQYGVQLVQLTLTPSNSKGLVQASLVLAP